MPIVTHGKTVNFGRGPLTHGGGGRGLDEWNWERRPGKPAGCRRWQQVRSIKIIIKSSNAKSAKTSVFDAKLYFSKKLKENNKNEDESLKI